ncbi:glycoside hydrolase family 13 protein [Actinoplanes sp. TRM 88003]|uniref:Glycoside hydrolase family 13 protein n=1 Tax=Paractinoplanes aksuensis TaxID=2939490 RepID=A0ABT1DU41_9ACTN|nr:glycoside hydrolase family 13 protein [Actinoplanes aksuensis]MCO8274366.1 glycoside hydrolase family 13 protein [Actinoplanes aksuensis]
MSAEPMQDTRPAEFVTRDPWWRDAVVYQVYLRSFADGNGDGVGDFPGLRSRLPYLAELGVDAVWVTPHYVSGGADGGYDVIDFRAVDPAYGTVDDVRGLVEDAHALGLRVLLDIVPNHTSDQHPWFQAALADPNSPEAACYHFLPASEEPPNNWQSMFGGPAWSRTPDGRWYLHLFTPQQPDLNWDNPDVADDFDRTLKFWFDLGVDGFRVDVAYGLFKDPSYRDNPGIYSPTLFGHGPEQAMTTNQPQVHEIWRRWRALCDSYDEPKMLVGEVSLADLDEVGLYARPDELHHAFQFRLLKSDWDASSFADTIAEALTAFETVGAPAPWVLGNHDKARQVTRYGSERRARAAALLMLALPGSAYLYAGEELGLPEADVPDADRRDPIFFRSQGRRPGRDGCRIPMPWEADDPNAGFSAATPWLPQPAGWPSYAVDRQESDPNSTFTLYQQALMLRKLHPALGSGRATVTLDGDVIRVDLVARNGDPSPITCWINMGGTEVTVPATTVLLASAPDVAGPSNGRLTLAGDTAVWTIY